MRKEIWASRVILNCCQCRFSEVVSTNAGDLRYCASPDTLKEKTEFIRAWGEIPDGNYAIACSRKQIQNI
jgi:hypothetical protein